MSGEVLGQDFCTGPRVEPVLRTCPLKQRVRFGNCRVRFVLPISVCRLLALPHLRIKSGSGAMTHESIDPILRTVVRDCQN